MHLLRRLLRGAGHRRPGQAPGRALPAPHRGQLVRRLRSAPGHLPRVPGRRPVRAHRRSDARRAGAQLPRRVRPRRRGAGRRGRAQHARGARAAGGAVTFQELTGLPSRRSNFGMKLGLERMREALSLLGDPHLACPVLHVAGSNGKGSTCAFVEAALRAAGLRTGLYTSPHLFHFCERIRVAGEPVSEERAAALLEEIARRVPGALTDEGLTFFELTTLMGFLAFAQDRVQVAVVEVGLGGRLDATNVVEPLACAVAPIALEHTTWLGPTLAHVAAEKAGIFKEGAPAVSAGQPREAAEVLQRRAGELGIPLWRPGRDYRFESRDVRPFCYQGSRWAVRARDLALQGHHH